jgi:hypothetical protein
MENKIVGEFFFMLGLPCQKLQDKNLESNQSIYPATPQATGAAALQPQEINK